MITLGVFVLGYLYCLTQFPGFASTRVICNILTDNAFLGIIAVGMTFVILSGGIDLSVGSVIAFTGVFLAKAIGFWGISPLLAFPLVLVMGCAFGAFMGLLIDALKIPAFIITLAGMFFLRGVSYLVSEESIPINHPVYDTLSSLAWKIPGGGRLSAMGLLMLGVVVMQIVPQMMQFQQLHQHQIEVDSLSSGNLSSIQPALRHLIDFITVQHQVGCESVMLVKKDVLVLNGQKLVQGMQVHEQLMLQIMSQRITAHHLLCLFV